MRLSEVRQARLVREAWFDRVTVADYVRDDISHFVTYWHDRRTPHVSRMGVDQALLPSAVAMTKALESGLDRRDADPVGRPLRLLAIRLDGRTVGFHQITDFDRAGRRAGMHACLTDPDCRGRGIGTVSYAKALALFFLRFALDEIYFDTPLNNPAALRVKAALGLAPAGNTFIDQPFLYRPLRAQRFVVFSGQVEDLLRRAACRRCKESGCCRAVRCGDGDVSPGGSGPRPEVTACLQVGEA